MGSNPTSTARIRAFSPVRQPLEHAAVRSPLPGKMHWPAWPSRASGAGTGGRLLLRGGASQSRGYSSNRGWSDDGLAPWDRTASGGHTRSRDRGQSEEWSESDATSDGENWSTAQSVQRVYEFAVEPTVLQGLPGNALLLPPRGSASSDVLAVECDPQIIMLPGAAADLAAAEGASAVRPAAGQDDWPALTPPTQGPAWQHWQGPLPATRPHGSRSLARTGAARASDPDRAGSAEPRF